MERIIGPIQWACEIIQNKIFVVLNVSRCTAHSTHLVSWPLSLLIVMAVDAIEGFLAAQAPVLRSICLYMICASR